MGKMVFYDIFENVVKSVRLTVDDRIKAGKTITWDGDITYNQFMSEDVRFRDLKAEDLKMEFQPSQIVYTDRTKETFGGGD